MRLRASLAMLAVALIASGCGSRELVVLLPSEEGRTGQLVVSPASGDGTIVLNEPLAAAEVDGEGKASPVSLSTATLRDRYGALPEVMPAAPTNYVVHFESGSADLTPPSLEALQAAVSDLASRAGAEVEVIGHTDTVGAHEDNDRLSRERAEVVGAMLEANAVDGSLIIVSGRGEREPVVPSGDNMPEPRNRRVQIVVR